MANAASDSAGARPAAMSGEAQARFAALFARHGGPREFPAISRAGSRRMPASGADGARARVYRVIGADGKEYGPVSADQVRQWVAEGRANARTRVRGEGDADFRALESVPELAAALASSGAAPAAGAPTAAVPNYLTQAILVTLFCCMPFGIPAIVHASRVNTKLSAGDLTGALASSQQAKRWCWWAVGGYFAAILVYGVFAAIVASRQGALE